jgi:hypothetical protein
MRIGDHYARIKALPGEASFIKEALRNFSTVRDIASRSELLVVGYFSVIESLVTHQPRQNENLDSIRHQVMHKLVLLSRRFERQILPGEYFHEASLETIWDKLYGYRSCLAHGGVPDFTKKLALLKSAEPAIRFVREVIKELIILGTREHQFLADLKEC